MKNICLVTTRFPWPLTNGFANKNYWLIRGLSENYKINLFVIQRKTVANDDLAKIAGFCNSIMIFKPSIFDYFLGLINCLIKDWPIQLALFYSHKAKKIIDNQLLSADFAFSSVIRGVQYIEKYHGSIFCDLADSLGQLYIKDAKKFMGIKRLVYQEEGRRMKKYERFVVDKSNQTFLFNSKEAKLYPDDKVTVVAHGINPKLFEIMEYSTECANGVVLFGRMNFEPNIIAAEWFVENVFPKLPSWVHFYIIGADPSARVLKLQQLDSRIVVKGYLENPYPALRGAIANICPIQTGGGIQNKVLEGLAIGALNFVSPLATEPLQDIESSGIIVCEYPEDWIKCINTAIMSADDYSNNRTMGREYAQRYFSWDSYAQSIMKKLKLVEN